MYEDPDWDLYFKSMLFGANYLKFYERVWNKQKQSERLVIIFAMIGLVVGSLQSIWYQRDILDMESFSYYYLEDKSESFTCFVLRCIVSGTTVGTIIFLIRRVRIGVELFT